MTTSLFSHALYCIGIIIFVYGCFFYYLKAISSEVHYRTILRVIGGIASILGGILLYQIPQEADRLLIILNWVIFLTFPIFYVLIIIVHNKQTKAKYKKEDRISQREYAASLADASK